MKSLRRHAFSINTILLLCITIVIALMMLLGSTVVASLIKNTFIDASVDSSSQLVSQSGYTLNRFFLRINTSLYNLARSSTLIDLCRQEEEDSVAYSGLMEDTSRQIEIFLGNQEDISNVFVLKDGACLYQSGLTSYPVLDDPLIQELFARQEVPRSRIITYHPVSHPTYYNNPYPYEEFEIPISLLIQDPAPPLTENHGILLVTMRLTVLDDFFSQMDSDSGLTAFILDKKGNVFYSSEHHLIGMRYADYLKDCSVTVRKDSFLCSTSGQQILLEHSQPLNFNSWTLVLTTDLSGLNDRIQNTRLTIFAFSALILAAAFGLIGLITRRLTAPLANLSRQMEHIDYAALSQKMDSRYPYREVKQLYNGYNHMLERIEELIDKVYYEQLRQKDAQYEALQAKINPHFLYNTLQSISALAILGRNDDIETVTNALGGMLEYLTYEKSSEVLLSRDFDYIKNYIQIQQLRYNNRFIAGYEIDPRTLSCRVQKLLLQPMVENAIKHGLEQKQSGGHLFIRTFLKNDLLIIEVEDNGAGMDAETLEKLIRHMNLPDKDSSAKSIGLSNVQERIHLKYGPSYGITIQSRPKQGTTVTVTIPAIYQSSLGNS